MRKRLALLGAVLALGALVTALTVGSRVRRPRCLGTDPDRHLGCEDRHPRAVRPAVRPAVPDADRADQQVRRRARQQDQRPVDRHEVGQADGGDERRGADLEGRSRDHRHLRLRLLVPGDQRGEEPQGAGHRALRLVAEGRDAGDRRRLRRLDGPRLGHRRRGRWPSGSGRTSRPEAGVRLQGHVARVLEGDGGLLQGPLDAARREGLRRGHLRRRREPRPLLADHPPARQGQGL